MNHLIAQNLEQLHGRMAEACRAASRNASDVRLVAVSKTHPLEIVREALKAGQRVFGENRVQEAAQKFEILKKEFSDLKLHLIGPLQTNKAEDAVRLFDVIETLDRPKLADALAEAIAKTKHAPLFYIEVNIGDEPQKSGVAPHYAGDFLAYCRTQCALQVEGLMCIPPVTEDPALHFRALKDLAEQLRLPYLSMGMSGDFEKAIACGATEIRVGTAIFGARTEP